MTHLVNRVTGGAKSATGKVELVRAAAGTFTALMTFDLTDVSVETFDDSYSTVSGGSVQDGAEKIVLRYGTMTMTCPPTTCAQPTHDPGSASELAAQDFGVAPVKVLSGDLSVPKNLKETGVVTLSAAMAPSYLLPGLITHARDGKAFEKLVQVDLVRLTDDTARKAATYKLGAASIASLAIERRSGDPPLVEVAFASRQFSVMTYSYTATGVAEKPLTACFPSCTGL